jgi:hypothetical protein
VEKLGKPGVAVVTDTFLADALSSAQDNEMPNLRFVAVPARNYYTARSQEPEMKAVAAKAFDAIVTALTKPLTEGEAKAGPAVAQKVEKTVTFGGTNYREAADAVNTGFFARRWADGLPIIPPTQEAVKWMLTGTSRSPDEVIGVPVAPKGGKCTIEKIAINAVMAGAKPEYLPVIIAAMEVLTDKSYFLLHLQASASSIAPVIFVNGPIATELGINSGIGFLGHGNQANNTIGRAVRLCLINLGHTWPGENDMAQLGRSAAFGNWTFAEDEKENPWKPYHVELGFKAEDSTVTVCSSNYFKTGPGGQVTPQSIYEQLVLLARVIEVTDFPTIAFAVKGGGTILLGMNPNLAQGLAKVGFTKDDVKRWLYEHARIPYSELTAQERKDLKLNLEKKNLPMQFWVGESENTKGKALSIPVVNEPDKIRIVVVGQPGGLTMVWKYDLDDNNRGHGTKKITGATLTKAGR